MNADRYPRYRLLAIVAISALAAAGAARMTAPHLSTHTPPLHAAAAEDAPVNAQGRPASVAKTLSCEPLPNVPGKSISTALVTLPPNAYAPPHRHPGSVTAYVLKGTVRSQLNTDPVATFAPGQTWFEPPGTLHTLTENASAVEPAELYVVFIHDDNCGPLTVFEPR